MPTNVQDLPAREVNVLNKHTGFPEPLSPDRNTTLPHPDADTSQNATIEAPDVDLTRTHSRNSFLHRRHHSKNSFGKIGMMKETGLYDNIQYADGTHEVNNTKTLDVKSPTSEGPVNGVSQHNGAVNGEVGDKPVNGNSNGETIKPANGYTNGHKRTESSYSTGEKKKSLFGRLSLHR